MLDRGNGQVDIQLGPIEVLGSRSLEPKDRLNRSALEPGEILKGQKQLAAIQEQPETMLRCS
jgi:hypothetical protein